jgi:hypothetical protein
MAKVWIEIHLCPTALNVMKLAITQYLSVYISYVRSYADKKRKAVNVGRISFTSSTVAFMEPRVTEHIMWSFVHQMSLKSIRMCVNYQ